MKSFFVSSTFQDMHYERDIIHTKVIPALNTMAMEYGEAVSACDLRWGIDTSEMNDEKGAMKVLEVCLNEIDRCRPYMVVLLGYRYGWMPGENIIENTIKSKEGFHLVDKNISVTALEIEYGSLFKPDLINHTLFYFREIDGLYDRTYSSENTEHMKKLEVLKERIRAIPGSHVRTYHIHMDKPVKESLENFANMLLADMSRMMIPEWKKNVSLNKYELDQKKQLELMREKITQFSGRFNLLNKCLGELANHGGNLFLHGAAGSGKSTLISRIGLELQKSGHIIIPVFCGYTPLCCSSFDILKYIIRELEDAVGIQNSRSEKEQSTDLKVWYELFHQLLTTYGQHSAQKITFLIDGIDQLFSEDILKEISFLADANDDNVSFILSGITEGRVIEGIPAMEVGDLSQKERREVISGILAGAHRELSERVIDCICSMEQSTLPLFISLIVQRLIMMNHNDYEAIMSRGGGIQAIEVHQKEIVRECPQDVPNLSAYVLDFASEIAGIKEQNRLMNALIATSRRGLRLSDLEGIMSLLKLKWSPVDAAAYIQYMSSAFIYRSDGRIDFSHKSIRQGYLDAINDPAQYHRLISIWLDSLDKKDEVRIQELCWHLIRCDEKLIYADIVCNYMYDKVNVTGISRDCANSILNDSGEWFIQVLDKIKYDNSFSIFSNMFTLNVFFEIPDTKAYLRIKMRICDVIFRIMRERIHKNDNYSNNWDMTIVCERLAYIFRALETDEYLSRALEVTDMSLTIRKTLIKRMQQLDTPEKMRQHWTKESAEIAIAIKDAPSDYQLKQLTNGFLNEMRRGLIVANKDMSQIYSLKGDKLKALQYIGESIRDREELFSVGHGSSFILDNETSELADSYCMAAIFCLDLGKEYENTGEEYCKKAITLCSEALKNKEDDSIKLSYCNACIILSSFYKMKGDGFIDEAIKLCLQCRPILEKMHKILHTDGSRKKLTILYDRLSNLYGLKEDEKSKKEANYYNEMGAKIVTTISAEEKESLDGAEFAANAEMSRAVRISRNTSVITPELVSCFRKCHRLLTWRLQQLQSKKAVDTLCDMYDTLIDILQEFEYIDDHIRTRGELEINIKKLDILIDYQTGIDDQYRSTIVRYAKIADKMIELKQSESEKSDFPPALTELLAAVDISPETVLTANMSRAYTILGTVIRNSKELVKNTDSLKDYDILATTLSRYATISAVASPETFLENTDELFRLSNMLYKQTGKEKYLTMTATALMLRKVFNNKES